MSAVQPISHYSLPDERGHFGPYGGTFVAETLMRPLAELCGAYADAKRDPEFLARLDQDLKHYVGRPSPLYFAKRLTRHAGGARIYLKREDLNHTGAHKINNTVGQALLGLDCVVYMGSEDMERQAVNVYRMKLLGAEVVPVESGSKTLKDALNEALRDWVTNVNDTFYIIGTVAGPHPYPAMVRDFQAVIGRETRAQMLEMRGRLPDAVVACVGGGSNAMGIFYPFIEDAGVALHGVEAGGEGLATRHHAALGLGGREHGVVERGGGVAFA